MTQTPSESDYSGYPLNQLYTLLRDTDKVNNPERFLAISEQIRQQGGEPHLAWVPPFWTRRPQVTPILKLVRWLVGFQYGAVFGWLVYVANEGIMTNNETQTSGVALAMMVIPVVCGLGVVTMHDSLRTVTNRAAVEIGWLSALGLAPFAAVLYATIASYLFAETIGFLILPLLLIVVPIGFYSPFVLLTMWIKYHYRDDEF